MHTPNPARTLDAARLETVLSLLGGSLSVDEAARRHGVSPEVVEGWRALYLAAAQHAARSVGPARPVGRWALTLGGVLAASVLLVAATARSQQAVTCGGAGWPSLLFCFDPNQPARAAQVNGNFKQVADWNVPVGGIVAWHKNVATTPLTLPSAWVECNGQTLSDNQSPLNGRVMPNLNGQARFLRGATSSGTMQDDALQGHRHNVNSGTIHLLQYVWPNGSRELYSSAQAGACGGGCSGGYYDEYTVVEPSLSDPVATGSGTPRVSTETRPSNMGVVWIIRVK